MKYFNFLLLMFFSLGVFAQNVSGTVTGDDGEPLIGANIIVQGSDTGVATDIDGNYTISANQGDILEISYLGFVTKTMSVNGNTMDISLSSDINTLDNIIVSATRRPVRKLQATTAVNSIGTQELATIQPETYTEAIANTPGITVNESQGRKGGFNIRGFPGGNVYTTTLLDGLPASGFSSLSSGTQEFYSFDPSVDRIEVVRGAAATLFGKSAAAGAVNIISRTGGAEHGGGVSFTRYNNVAQEGHQFEGDFDYRLDFGINGPLAENLRYNIGGFLLNDSGQKEQHHKDEGYQLRANIDWLISEKSNIRFSATALNTSFNNNIETAWNFQTNSLGGSYTGASSSSPSYESFDTLLPLPTPTETGEDILRNPADFREKTWGASFGVDANFDLGNGFSFNQKARFQKFNWNDMNDISFSDFFDDQATFVFRFLGRSEQDNNTIMSESRISKELKTGNALHNFSAGLFYSDGRRDRLGTNMFYFSNIDPRPTNSIFGTGLRDSATTSHREEKTTGVFIGDEVVFNEKLSINAAFRYDWFNPLFTNDPGEISSTGTDATFQESIGLVTIDSLSFSDFSFSIGANYLIGESSAIYGNFLRAFSLPGVTTRTFVKPDGNEIINNFELGYRAGFNDLTVDATLFSTRINNRVALALNDVTREFEPRAGGTNKILGAELGLTYTPKAIKGLILQANVTSQNSEYVEFKIPLTVNSDGMTNVDQSGDLFGVNIEGSGTDAVINLAGNQVEATPTLIYSMNLAYKNDNFGANFGGFTYAGTVADATNLFETPNLSVYNAGAHYALQLGTGEVKIGFRIKNVFNLATPQLIFATNRGDAQLREKQANPNPGEDRLAWAIIQNPRRVLLTIGYNF